MLLREQYREQYHNLIETRRERLRFVGLLEYPAELSTFYAMVDVLVIPSESECFGVAIRLLRRAAAQGQRRVARRPSGRGVQAALLLPFGEPRVPLRR